MSTIKFAVGDKVRSTKMCRMSNANPVIKVMEVGRKWGKEGGKVYDAILGCKRIPREYENDFSEWSKPHVYLTKNLELV